jgi:hypothetical protein
MRGFHIPHILAPMKLQTKIFTSLFGLLAPLAMASSLHAVDIAPGNDSSASTAGDTRYGFLDLLDHRSSYGQGVYPEPFLVDDSDLEVNEFRLDWLHTKANAQHSDTFTAEVEKGFGNLTLEVEVPFERDVDSGSKTSGFADVDLGARYPLYQYVPASGAFDTTFGTAIEVGVPTNSMLGKNTEIVPKIFNDLRVGSHFTLQSIFGYSALLGSGNDGGLDTFEYGFVLGYTIPRKELAIPHVQQLIPVFELSGESQLNKDNPDRNSLIGNIGFRVNMDAVGPLQPRLGFGFVFPMNSGARDDVHWGLVTSLVFEY